MRRIAVLLAAGIFATANPALADVSGTGGTVGTGTTTAAFTAADFLIRIEYKSGDKWILLPTDTTQFNRFFTRARCVCNEEIRLRADLLATGIAKVAMLPQGGVVRILVGPTSACVASSNTDRNNANCWDPAAGGSVTLGDLRYAPYTVPVNMQKLFQPQATTVTEAGCTTVTKQSVFLWVDSTQTSVPDSGLSDSSAPTLQLPIDGQPPPEPSNVKVGRGGEALTVSWDPITGVPDLSGGGFVVFCARGGDLAVFADPQYTGAYDSPAVRCPTGAASNVPVGDGGAPDARVAALSSALTASPDADTAQAIANDYGDDGTPVPPPVQFTNIDPAYQCSSLITSATSARIKGLQNGVPYVVGVASVDKTGNASPITRAYVQAPIPTRDFYRGYRAAGGQADGGYCAVGGRGSRSLAALTGLAGVALLWRRRQRGRRTGRSS
jgi:hypothetical protein